MILWLQLLDTRPDRSCWMLFRLGGCILILAETVSTAPCHIMSSKYLGHGYIVDIEDISVTFDAACLLRIPVRDTKAAAIIVDKTVEGDLPFRTQIVRELDSRHASVQGHSLQHGDIRRSVYCTI